MAQQIHYFLGANSKDGFRSLYSELFNDKRVQTVWIIKGGPGNGKSTFMRALGETAEQHDCEQEYILCSSDPDSLDGLIIPAAGIAIVDGTAPHILEPQLCGLDAKYVDFSQCYRQGMETVSSELNTVQKENKACYIPAYVCLSSAAALRREVWRSVRAKLPESIISSVCDGILQQEICSEGNRSGIIRRFFSGITPKGLQYRIDTPSALCDRLYILKDSYGMSHEIFTALLSFAMKKRQFCIVGMSPLAPEQIEQLILPELHIGILRSSQQTAYHGSSFCQIDLDALCDKYLTNQLKKHIPFLLCTSNALIEEAISHLQEAKAFHDKLEVLCRPFVDFSVATGLRERYQEKLASMLPSCHANCAN